MGRHRLHAGPGGGDPRHRLGRAPVRCQARLRPLARAIRRRLGAVRPGHLGHRAHPVPRPAGHRRRDDPPGGPADDGRGGGSQADGPRDEHRGRPGDAGPDPGPDDRRPDPRQHHLALDLLRQPADRPDRGARRGADPPHRGPSAHREPGLPRLGADGHRTAAGHLRPGRDRRHRRLHLRQGDGADPARTGPGGVVRSACAPCAPTAAQRSPVPQAHLLLGRRWRCSAWARPCSAA